MSDNLDNARIFAPVEPLADLLARIEKKREGMSEKEKKVYAGPDTYIHMYAAIKNRLKEKDVVTVAAIARRMGIKGQDFKDLADRGQAILIEIEGEMFAPLCQLNSKGKIDDLKLDIAREFAVSCWDYFKFESYLNFMEKELTRLEPDVPPKKLKALFKSAGVGDYKCTLTVEANMNQLADGRRRNPSFFPALINHLKAALTWGGWEPRGGLTRRFMDKYNIPGLTIEEEHERAICQSQQNQSGMPRP